MNILLKTELIIVSFMCLIFIIYSIKKGKIDLNYSLVWLFSSFLMLIFAIIPDFIENISKFVGFEKASNMVFCLAIGLIICILFNISTIITKQSKKIIKLVQEISLASKKIEELEKKIEELEKNKKI